MKKLLRLITMLFLASAMVISCSSGSGSGSDVPSTGDCTETVTTLELSDGEWTVYMTQTADFMTEKQKLEATVTDGAYKFTSGKGSMTADMEEVFSLMGEKMGMTAEEVIEMLKNMTDEQKNAMLEESMGEEIPEGYDVSWDGLTLNVEATASAEDLAEMEDFLDLKYMPTDAEIKTNADRTKYTINFSLEDDMAGTLNVEIIAIKKLLIKFLILFKGC